MYRYHCYGRRFGSRHVFTCALLVLLECVPFPSASRNELDPDDDSDILSLEKVEAVVGASGAVVGYSAAARNASTHHHRPNSTHGQHVVLERTSDIHGPWRPVAGTALASLSQGTVAVHALFSIGQQERQTASSSIGADADRRGEQQRARIPGQQVAAAELNGWLFVGGIAFALIFICCTISAALRTAGPSWFCSTSAHRSEPEGEPEGALHTESLERLSVFLCAPGDEKALHVQQVLSEEVREHVRRRLCTEALSEGICGATPVTSAAELSLQRQFEESFLAADDDVTPVSGAALRRDAVGVAVDAAVASVQDSVRAGLSLNAVRKAEAEIAMAPERLELEAAALRAAQDHPRIHRGEDPFDHCFAAKSPSSGKVRADTCPELGAVRSTRMVRTKSDVQFDQLARRRARALRKAGTLDCSASESDSSGKNSEQATRDQNAMWHSFEPPESDAPAPDVDPSEACPSAATAAVERPGDADAAPAVGDALSTQEVHGDSEEVGTATAAIQKGEAAPAVGNALTTQEVNSGSCFS